MATETIFIAVEVEGGKAVKTLAQLKSEMKLLRDSNTALNKQLKKGSITLDQFGKAASKNDVQLKKLSSQYREATNAASGLTKEGLRFRDKLAGSLTKAMFKIGAAVAAAFAAREILAFGKHVLEVTKVFESSLAELSAITGAAGEDLEFLSDKALELSANSTKSAAEVLTAFKKIASAKPELLENSAALAELTKQAIILSEASGLDLATAAEQLGSALNAMNLEASESGRVIDVLANASKLGAREIPFINAALSKFGGVAAQAGVSIEDSAAAIEVLGKVIPEASIVGTSFRNVLTIMQVEAQKAGREFEGLDAELERLAPNIDDVAGLTKTFGRESLLAVQTLIRERDALDELSGKLNESGTALEQATINANTLEGAMTKLGNVFDNALILVGTQGSGGLTDIINDLAQGFAEFTGQVDENTESVSATNKVLETSSLLMSAFRVITSQGTQGVKGLVSSFKELFNIEDERAVNSQKQLDAIIAEREADEALRASVLALAEAEEEETEVKKTSNVTKRKSTEDTKAEKAALDAKNKAIADNIKLEEERLALLKKEKAAREDLFTFLLTEDEKEIQALNQKFEAINELNIADKEQALELERQHQEALNELIAEQDQKKIDKKQEEDDAADAKTDKEKAEALEKQLFALDTAQQGLAAIQNLTNVFSDNKLKRLDKDAKSELAIINQRETDGFLTQEEADLARIKLQEDTDKSVKIIEKRAFQRNKAFSLASAGIDIAKGVAKALGSSAPPVSIIQAAIVATLGAVQIAAIASQRFAKKGAIVPKLSGGGILQGASHALGGIPISVGGRQVVEAEGGEPILTKGVSENPSLLAAASRINVMGGGRPLFQEGGVLPNFEINRDNGQSNLLAALSELTIESKVSVEEIMDAANNVTVAEEEATVG